MMETELGRISTFSQFPSGIDIYVTTLARNGFFYTGNNAVVQCVCCGFKFDNWLSSNRIKEMHRKASPSCTLVSQENSNQCVQTTSDQAFVHQEREICDSTNKSNSVSEEHQQNVNMANDSSMSYNQSMNSRTNDTEVDGFGRVATVSPHQNIRVDRARYLEFTEISSRHETFRNWPSHLQQNPNDLAIAGFFYTGVGDTVKCFACGGGLKDWEPEDIPCVEHAVWFPRCEYLRKLKGQAFINHIQDLKMAMLSSEDAPSQEASTNKRPETQLPVFNQESERKNVTLHSPAVQSVLEMGYAPEIVMSAVKKAQENGKLQPTAVDIMGIILEDEDILEPVRANPGVETSKDDVESPMEVSSITDEINRVSLENENRQLREKARCKICLDDKCSIVFLPCGHLCSCTTCAPALKNCPICRKLIHGTVKTFMA